MPKSQHETAPPALDLDSIFSIAEHRSHEILERREELDGRRRGWLVRRMLVAADVCGLSLAFAFATVAYAPAKGVDHVTTSKETLLFLLALPVWVLAAKLNGLYKHDEERTDHSTTDDLLGVFHTATIGTWIVYVTTELLGAARPELPRVVLFWLGSVLLVPLVRTGARAYSRRQVVYLQNTVVVGAGHVGQMVARKFLQHPEYGINLVGFVDAEPRERPPALAHVGVLGSPEQLPKLVRLLDIERIVIAFSGYSNEDMLDLIRSLNGVEVQIDIVPRYFELLSPAVAIHTVEGVPLLGLPPFRLSRSSRVLKRATDVVLSAFALFALAPVFALVALFVKLDSPGPVFFRQERMGARERTFRIYKFRTMVVDAEEIKADVAHLNQHEAADPRMFKVPDDPRVTRFGCTLRRYSLDELPQLINVFKGDMSLVGPRPLILAEDVHVRDWARMRLVLKPGVTGLWQVLGASDIPFDEMTKLDYLYVTNWSLWNDLRLMLRTVPAVMRTRQAY